MPCLPGRNIRKSARDKRLKKMKITIAYTLLITLFGCHNIKENNMAEIPLNIHEEIMFDGAQTSKRAAVELLDKVLKEQGDLGVYGNLRGGVEEISKEMKIKIKEEVNYYFIDIFPKSNTGGHDFSFTIDKKTEKMSHVVVGEVLPEPKFEN